MHIVPPLKPPLRRIGVREGDPVQELQCRGLSNFATKVCIKNGFECWSPAGWFWDPCREANIKICNNQTGPP